jgi:hypothetical protein
VLTLTTTFIADCSEKKGDEHCCNHNGAVQHYYFGINHFDFIIFQPAAAMTTNQSVLRLARGPLLVTAVVISYFFPYLQHYGVQFWNECCSTTLFVHLVLAFVGVLWMAQDLSRVTLQFVRSGCDKCLTNLVLDDLLKSIYDPETGWIACLTGVFVGASSMYGLKMNPEQRCKLVQSSLGLPSEQEAHLILLEPGGCKALLPAPVQDWLQPTEETMVNDYKSSQTVSKRSSLFGNSSTPGDISIDTNSTYCDGGEMEYDRHEDVIVDGETVRRARGLSFQYEEEDAEESSSAHAEHQSLKSQQQSNESSSRPTECHESNPLAVFVTILKGIAHEQIKPYAEAFPRSTVENVGMTAATALVLQLILRRSSKRHVTLGRLVAAALSSIAAVSFGSILTREAVLGHVHDKTSLQLVCRDMVMRLMDKLKRNVLSNKAKSFLAMAVLLILGKSPTQASPRR